MLSVVVSNQHLPATELRGLMPRAVLDERAAVVQALLARQTLTDTQRQWVEELGRLLTDDQHLRQQHEDARARRMETRIRWHDNANWAQSVD